MQRSTSKSPTNAELYRRYADIYRFDAEKYDQLVSREDVDGNILPALRKAAQIDGADIVEVGAGTARIARLVAPYVRSVKAFDIEPAMVQVARGRCLAFSNVEVNVAGHSVLPLPECAVDASIAAWTLCHIMRQSPNFERELDSALNEMSRVLKPGGRMVVLETLGTGVSQPNPPSEGLRGYYSLLEARYGFQRESIQTDYQFQSLDEAEALVRFFFGDELGDRVVRDKLIRLPEFTGVWTRTRL